MMLDRVMQRSKQTCRSEQQNGNSVINIFAEGKDGLDRGVKLTQPPQVKSEPQESLGARPGPTSSSRASGSGSRVSSRG